jgi:hypothetical protein
LDISTVRRTQEYVNDPNYRHRVEVYFGFASRRESLVSTVRLLRMNLKKVIKLTSVTSEADVGEMSAGPVQHMDEKENLIMTDPVETKEVSSTFSSTIRLNPVSQDLKNFLERPIEIFAGALSLSTDINQSYDIVNLLLAVPSIRAKLKNYAFIKFTINAEVIVSVSPFHQGGLLLGIYPFVAFNDMANRQLGLLSGTKRLCGLQYLSSGKYSQFMDVRQGKSARFSIDWIHPQPLARLFNTQTTITAAGTNYDDLAGYMTMYISTLNQLKAASATPSTPFMYIYAWLSNVELAGLTGTNVAITSESDERKSGPISRFSSAMVSVGTALSSIPFLKPYTYASNMIFTGVGALAAHFGYSMPTLTNAPERMRPDAFQSTALTIGNDTSLILALDHDIEMPVDSSIVSEKYDEMAISYIARIPSWLTSFTWAESSATMVPLKNIAVSPGSTQLALTTSFQLTNVGFAALPFTSWRGTMKYLCRVITNQFGRGKIAVFYEPNISQLVLINSSLQLNKQRMIIIDIAETQEFTICVNWNSQRMYLLNQNNVQRKDSLTLVTPLNQVGCSNGVLMFVPITQLQVPYNTSAEVNIFVSSDDIEFNGVSQPTNSFAYSESDVATERNTCFDINENTLDKPMCAKLHYGEKPLSFRALIKRFYTSNGISASAVGVAGLNHYIQQFPILPALYPNISGTTSVDAGYGMLGTIRSAFLGYRGGMRKKIRIMGWTNTNTGPSAVMVNLSTPSTSHGSVSATFTGPSKMVSEGTVTFVPTTNGGMEVRLPFYTNNLFGWAGRTGYEFAQAGTAVMEPTAFTDYTVSIDYFGIAAQVAIYEDSAPADDFSLLFYMGPPGYSG